MKEKKDIQAVILASIIVKEAILHDAIFLEKIESAAKAMVACFRQGGKVLFCGNGGSAADAQHIAAELSGRFYKNRAPLYAEALHVNSSFLTAVSNDYGYDAAYARMVEAAGRSNDILVAISTSGDSPNILQAAAKAKEAQMHIIALTGQSGGALAAQADTLLNIPSKDTPRIQEAHILIGHILCEWVETALFP